MTGGPGDDTFVPGYDLLNDTVDGGTGFDTILVEGTSFNDRIDVIQDSPTQLRYNLLGVNGGTGVVPGARNRNRRAHVRHRRRSQSPWPRRRRSDPRDAPAIR